VLDIIVTQITTVNGSPLISYNIDIDDGLGGDFVELIGIVTYNMNLEALASTGIQTGRLYRV
jgi:hypothetical protein